MQLSLLPVAFPQVHTFAVTLVPTLRAIHITRDLRESLMDIRWNPRNIAERRHGSILATSDRVTGWC